MTGAASGRPRFAGAGYTLGSSENDSARIPGITMPIQRQVCPLLLSCFVEVFVLHAFVTQVDVVLKLWRNGFSIDDGNLRDYNDGDNRQFLDSIKRG